MRLPLTMAISDYVHIQDLIIGRVQPEGIDLNILSYPFERVGLRFAMSREFDVSEFSLAGYCAHVAEHGMRDMVGIPVFPSRVFRQSGFYVNEKFGILDVTDLKGKTVGLPQWSQTATVYARGYLTDDVGIALQDIDWVQAGVNRPGRKEGVSLNLPEGIRLRKRPDASLSDLLAEGAVDAVISARPPNCFLTGQHGIRRLFDDPRGAEAAYFERTGIFPIMHVMVLRRDVFDANRWIARNLLEAFDEAKRNAFAKLNDLTTSFVPVAWGPDYFRDMNRTLFPDTEIWPYGLKGNRATLDAFLRFCHEQGVTARPLTPDDLFPPECSVEVIV